MGALPSQKYEVVLFEFMKWYNKQQGFGDYIILEEDIKEFLRKCDNLEIDVR